MLIQPNAGPRKTVRGIANELLPRAQLLSHQTKFHSLLYIINSTTSMAVH